MFIILSIFMTKLAGYRNLNILSIKLLCGYETLEITLFKHYTYIT